MPLLKFFASQDAHRRARAAVKQRYKVKSLATAKAVATEGIPVGARVAYRAALHEPEHPAEFTVLSWEEVPRLVDRPAGTGWVALAGSQGDIVPAQASALADYPAVSHRWSEDRPFLLFLRDRGYPDNQRRYETFADAEEAARDLTAKKITFNRNYPPGGHPEDPVARTSAVLLQVRSSEELITTTLDALVNTSRFVDMDLLAGLTEAVLALPEPTSEWMPGWERRAAQQARQGVADDAGGDLNWHDTLRIRRLRVPAARQPLLVGSAATPQSHERSLLVYSSTIDVEEDQEDDYGEPLDTYTMDAFVMLHSDRPALIGALRSGEEEVRVDGVLYHADFDDFRSIARRGGDRVRALPGEDASFFRRANGEMVPLAALVERYGDRADLVGKLRAAAPGLSVDAEGAIFERCSRPDTCRPLVPAGQAWTDELRRRAAPGTAPPPAQAVCSICHQLLIPGHLAAAHVLETERRLLHLEDPDFGDRGPLRDIAIRELRISRPASALLVLLVPRLRERVRGPVHDYVDRRRGWLLMHIHEAIQARGRNGGATRTWSRFAELLRARLAERVPDAPAASYLRRREPALRLLLASAREGFVVLPKPQPGPTFLAFLMGYKDLLNLSEVGRPGREVIFDTGENIVLPWEWPATEGAPLRLYPASEWVGDGPKVTQVGKTRQSLRHRDVVHLAFLRWSARLDDDELAAMARSWGYQEARHGTTPTDFAPLARILDAGSTVRVELVRSAFLAGMEAGAAGAAAP